MVLVRMWSVDYERGGAVGRIALIAVLGTRAFLTLLTVSPSPGTMRRVRGIVRGASVRVNEELVSINPSADVSPET
jgi:hypothetical protein